METGQMIAREVPAPNQPTPPAMAGSPIQAAAGALQDKELVLAGAVKNLGGGSRRRRSRGRRRRKFVGGERNIEVPKVPTMVSAGGADPKATYGGLLQLQHAAVAAGVYDGLGDATPMNMNATATTGGRRKRSRRRNNGRNKRSAKLRSRRTRRRTRHVRSSRR